MILLRALGQCAIHTSRAQIGCDAEVVFGIATYLIIERGRRLGREQLARLFWPDESRASCAQHRLRHNLYKLRGLGLPVGGDGRSDVILPADSARTDFDSLSECAPATERCADLAQRDLWFLPGYQPAFSAAFSDWLDDTRARIHASVVRARITELDQLYARGDWGAVAQLADRCLTMDPYNEKATLARANAAVMRGARVEAIEIMEQYAQEVGPVAPELIPAINTLRRRISDVPQCGGYAASRDTPLVGRAAEMALLMRALQSARDGHGGGTFLHGGVGVGKSRLTREMVGVCTLHGVQVQRTKCEPSHVHRPLSVFVDIVPGIRSMRGALGCSPETLGYLKRLTDHDAEATVPKLEADDAEFLYAAVRRSLFDLLDAVCDEAPLLVIVDDVHWVDSRSWSLLLEMAAWAQDRKLMFLFTSRSPWCTDRDGLPAAAIRAQSVGPLDSSAATALARGYAQAHGREGDEGLFEWCARVTEGNPFYIQELVNQWVETGQRHAVPHALTALINERLTRLEPAALHVFQTCAILGENSTMARLELLLQHRAHDLLRYMDIIGTAGMLLSVSNPDEPGTPARVVSRHELLARAALARLSDQARELLHRLSGKLLEAELTSHESTALLWDCADHWHAAGDSARAVSLGQSCCAHLLNVGLAREAVEACGRTLAFCATNAQKLGVLTLLAQARVITGPWRDVVSLIHDARQLTSAGTELPWALRVIELDALWYGNRDWPGLVESAQRLIGDPAPPPDFRVQAGSTLLKAATNMGAGEVIREVHGRLASVLESPEVSTITRLTYEMIYHTVAGDLTHVRPTVDQLIAAARQSNIQPGMVRTMINAAHALRRAGHIEEARSLLGEAFASAQASKLAYRAADTAYHLIQLSAGANELDEAEHWAERCLALAAPDDGRLAREVGIWHVRIALARGYTERAAARLAEIKQPSFEDTVTCVRSSALAVHVRLAVAVGTPPADLEAPAERLFEAYLQLRGLGGYDFETSSLALALRYMGRHECAARVLREYINEYRRERGSYADELAEQIAEDATPRSRASGALQCLAGAAAGLDA